ncbi:MAG: type II secretion system F family protein [Verrucomicrobiota bacterium]
MAQFSYKARRRSGEVVQGVLDVPDRSAALTQIERLGLFPVSIDAPKNAGMAMVKNNGNAAKHTDHLPPALRQIFSRKRKPKIQEIATFTTQLSNLLKSGMPLTVALSSMVHLESKGIPSDVSKQLKQDVMEGKGLSVAMSRQPHIFSDLYINMVKAGESSGALVEVLKRLATHQQQFAEVQSKFKSAMIYPILVCGVGMVIVAFFVFFMLPRFMTIFQGFSMALPLPTRVLMGFSNAVTSFWFWVVTIPIVLAIAVIFFRFKATEQGKRKIDQWKMNAPIVGKVIRLNIFGQFCRTLQTLLENGVPVLTALKITEDVMSNRIIKEAIAKTREEVTDGKTIAQPLARSQIFPRLMVDLIKIGEETGDVPGSLGNLADTYEGELSLALRVMMSLIEPVLIIVMAIGVGFLLMSILLPMFNLISNISGGR